MLSSFKSPIFYSSLFFVSTMAFVLTLPAEEATKTKETKQAVTKEAKAECKKCAKPAIAEKEMKSYKLTIPQTEVAFEMIPIAGGEYVMGSPESEKDRKKDEGPQHKVKVEPFWMGKYEVTWDEYDIWSYDKDITARTRLKGIKPTPRDKEADAVSRPTPPYTDMTFGYGHDRYPAICVTHLSARMYCKWLSAKTGHYYRLPTEAEWEYACRAGTKTAYSFGDDAKKN